MNTDVFRENINHIIKQFDSISLEEIESIKLMDRIDTKYIIPLPLLPCILEDALACYKILNIGTERVHAYRTLYFDTTDFQLYKQHQKGKATRFKIRRRTYVQSDCSFFEIKQKNPKGTTSKVRLNQSTTHSASLITQESIDFLEKQTPLKAKDLVESIWVSYQRITLTNKDSGERITIDLDLSFQKNDRQQTYPKIAILEVKQNKISHSPINNILKKYHLRSGSISKYCLGIISLHLTVKYNRFKPKLMHLNKIIKQYDILTRHQQSDHQPTRLSMV